jgi:hypothetical protein
MPADASKLTVYMLAIQDQSYSKSLSEFHSPFIYTESHDVHALPLQLHYLHIVSPRAMFAYL